MCLNLDASEIHSAVDSGDVNRVQSILEQRPEVVNDRTIAGSTPLHLAVGMNNAAITRLLIEKGADVNATTKEGFTPLHWAAYMNAGGAASILVQHGADLRLKTKGGDTAIEIAEREKSSAVVTAITNPAAQMPSSTVKNVPANDTARTEKADAPAEIKPVTKAPATSSKTTVPPKAVVSQKSDLIKQGKDAVLRGDLPKAYQVFGTLLKDDPGSETINFHYAMTCYKMRDFSRARLAFERVININPENAKAITMLGICNFVTGQLEVAKKHFDKALTYNPPPEDRQQIEKYLSEIQKGVKKWKFSSRLDVGYFDDDNVNVGPDSDIISISPIIFGSKTIDTLTLGNDSKPLSSDGYFVSIGLSSIYDQGNKGGWSTLGSAAYFQNWIDKANRQESKYTTVSLGLRRITGNSMLQMPFKAANINSGHKSLMNLSGVSPVYLRFLGRKGTTQLMSTGNVEARKYDELTDRDGFFLSAGETVKQFFGKSRHSAYTGILFSHDFTDKAIYEYNGISLNVGGDLKMPWHTSLYGRVKYTLNDYSEREALAPEKRNDDQFQYLIGINKTFTQGWGIDLNYQTTDNNSSFGLYEYERNVATLSTFVIF